MCVWIAVGFSNKQTRRKVGLEKKAEKLAREQSLQLWIHFSFKMCFGSNSTASWGTWRHTKMWNGSMSGWGLGISPNRDFHVKNLRKVNVRHLLQMWHKGGFGVIYRTVSNEWFRCGLLCNHSAGRKNNIWEIHREKCTRPQLPKPVMTSGWVPWGTAEVHMPLFQFSWERWSWFSKISDKYIEQ